MGRDLKGMQNNLHHTHLSFYPTLAKPKKATSSVPLIFGVLWFQDWNHNTHNTMAMGRDLKGMQNNLHRTYLSFYPTLAKPNKATSSVLLIFGVLWFQDSSCLFI